MSRYKYEDLLALMEVGAAHPGGMALTKEILSLMDINQDTEVLEVGCGTGETASYLTQRYGCRVTAIDKNPAMLEKASQRFRRENLNVRLFEANAEKLPFSDKTFDLVVVESVTIFTNIPQALREYYRVLSPGATLIDLEMTAEAPLKPWNLADFYSVYGIRNVPTQQDWFSLLQMSGFNFLSIMKGENINSLMTEGGAADDRQLKFDPAPLQNPELYRLFVSHQYLQMYYANLIGYRVYRGRRPLENWV